MKILRTRRTYSCRPSTAFPELHASPMSHMTSNLICLAEIGLLAVLMSPLESYRRHRATFSLTSVESRSTSTQSMGSLSHKTPKHSRIITCLSRLNFCKLDKLTQQKYTSSTNTGRMVSVFTHLQIKLTANSISTRSSRLISAITCSPALISQI